MLPPVDTRNPEAVFAACLDGWPAGDCLIDRREFAAAFRWVGDAFAGRHPEYEPLDMLYHDLEHTLQGTLCLARLLAGWHRAGVEPRLDVHAVNLGMVAILLHDTGYLKPRGDRQGTGAKFTRIHVHRSADFAERLLTRERFPADDIRTIQNMIRCTGVNPGIHTLSWENALHRHVGCALATADYLGQMAAADYVDRLPQLFDEFAEAARSEIGADPGQQFADAADLIRRTPGFWTGFVRPRLERDFEATHRYLAHPYPDGPNPYFERIEANVARVRRETAPATAGNA